MTDALGSKHDLRELEAGIEQVLRELRQDLREFEHRLTVRLGTIAIVALGTLAALMKLP